MDGVGGKIEEQVEPAAPPVPTKRLPGRPKGTSYRRVDQPLHERMRQLLQDGVVHSRTAAARQIVNLAYGHGREDSKIRRLVQSFPYT